MKKMIPQMQPWFGEEEKLAVCSYMDECGFITEYKLTAEFEALIAQFTNAKHAIVVNNGTVSLTLAALALGIGPGDEVIVPNYTMIATPNSVKILGATPVFVDVEANSLCLDLELVKAAITSKTKAIMLVSANGRYPSDGIENFVALSNATGIPIIEDAAQSLGSYFPDGRHIGTVGKIGSFSFSAPKIISTGQGGALITNDDGIAEKLRKLKDFGRSSGGNDVHDSIGYNFKFTELQAAIGIAQIRKLTSRVLRKREIWKKYNSGISSPEVSLIFNDINYTAPWFIELRAVNARDQLIGYLKDRGIGTRKMYPPINAQKAYAETGNFPVSESIGNTGLWIPSYTQIGDEEIEYICDQINKFKSL
jgi:perosamine synthetase